MQFSTEKLTFVPCNDHLKAKQLADIVQVMSFCGNYRAWTVDDIKRNIFPAIALNQTSVFYHLNAPIGFATWATFSQVIHESVSATGKTPPKEEWNSGDFHWIIDFASPFVPPFRIRSLIRRNVFPGVKCSYGVRRNSDTSIRKVVKIGGNDQ